MKILFCLLIASVILAGCSGNNKSVNGDMVVSIHRLWEFKNIDTALSHFNNTGSAWIGKNHLDLTNHDTLKFTYFENNSKAALYPYSVRHDTIFIQKKATYKILKLTASELDLGSAIHANPGDISIVMVYVAK